MLHFFYQFFQYAAASNDGRQTLGFWLFYNISPHNIFIYTAKYGILMACFAE